MKILKGILELLAVCLFYVQSFHIFSIIGVIILLKLLMSQEYYWLAILYLAYFTYDFYRFNKCGFIRFPLSRFNPIWKYLKSYFPVKLHKTCDIDSNFNYIFACAPHAIVPYGPAVEFSTVQGEFCKLFPGLRTHLLSLKSFFYYPLSREYFYSFGACAATEKCLKYILTQTETKGQVCCIIVGGSKEMTYTLHGDTYFLIMKSRKGFIRVALETGTPLVPVFSFGENDLYITKHVNETNHPFFYKVQNIFKQITGIGLPYFRGRGLLSESSFGFLPFRKPINLVIGKPIQVKRVNNPTQEQIDSLHELFMNEMLNLFETNKCKFDYEINKKIVFI